MHEWFGGVVTSLLWPLQLSYSKPRNGAHGTDGWNHNSSAAIPSGSIPLLQSGEGGVGRGRSKPTVRRGESGDCPLTTADGPNNTLIINGYDSFGRVEVVSFLIGRWTQRRVSQLIDTYFFVSPIAFVPRLLFTVAILLFYAFTYIQSTCLIVIIKQPAQHQHRPLYTHTRQISITG